MLKTNITVLILCLFFLAACGSETGAPEYILSQEPERNTNTSPSVNDTLAKDSGQIKLIYHVGPVDMPSGTEKDVMMENPITMRFQTDKEIWVTGFAPKVVDATGKELPSDLLHEAIVSNMHEENPLCSGSPNPFMIATSQLTEIKLPDGFGYPILSTDPLETKVVLKNSTDTSYINVFFEFTLTARLMNEFANFKDVKPLLLELNPCDHTSEDIAPNGLAEKSATYKIPQKAKLISAQAALQNYGSFVEIKIDDDLQPLWRSEAIVDDKNHNITEMSANPFEDKNGIDLKQDDPITLTVVYDNQSDKWEKGATAAAMLYLALEM